jgi:uncharacterized membrane protein
MTEAADNYVPLGVVRQFRQQAFRVWLVTLAFVAAWDLAIVSAPVARAGGLNGFSSPLYTFFSFICHQMPARSFYIDGEPFGVCTRCFGVYLGLLVGVGIYPLWRSLDDIGPLPRFWLFLSLIPMVTDWSLTFLGIWDNTDLSRFITGLIVGGACSTYIMPALVEITRNFSGRTYRARVPD